MTNDTPKIPEIQFKDFMSPKGSDSIQSLFDTLSDLGIPIGITAEQYCDEDDAIFDIDQLSFNLFSHGVWLIAKVKGFETLRDMGFDGIKIAADRCEVIDVRFEYGDDFKGEWCRLDDVIYASYGGLIEVASASVSRRRSTRDSDDLKMAYFLLLGLRRHLDEQVIAA